MPALTHGSVKNGFNLKPRIPRNNKTCSKVNDCSCENDNLCFNTKPICENKTTRKMCYYSRGCKQDGSLTKRASAVAGIGRSRALKRAISRRVTTNNCCGTNCKDSKGNAIEPIKCEKKDDCKCAC